MNMGEQDNNYIDLLSENLSNDTSEEKERKLEDWVGNSPDNKKLSEVLNRIEVSQEVSLLGKSLQESILSDVNRKIDRYSLKIRLYRISAVAACVIIILFSVNIFIQPEDSKEKETLLSQLEMEDTDVKEVQIISGVNQRTINNDETITQTKEGDILVGKEEKIESSDIKADYITVIVPRGKRSTIKFSDGSVASINSGSKIIYPKTFSHKKREIFLDGEIYINVEKDMDKPFLVHTKDMEIKVLGTQFNVNAYSDETSHAVVLVEGSVMIDSDNKKDILKPNQGFFINDKTHIIKSVDVYTHICWRNGILKIDGESFESLLKKLSRYYGVEISLAENLKEVKLEGSLDLGESLDDVLRILAISKPFTYQNIDNHLYVR